MSLQALIVLLASSRVAADWVRSENNYQAREPNAETESGEFTYCYDQLYKGNDLIPSRSEGGNQFKNTVAADFSVNWKIKYYNTYKVLTNEETDQKFVLHQCGVRKPLENAEGIPNNAIFVSVPVTRASLTSSTYIAYFEILGVRRDLKVLGTSIDFTDSPCINEMYDEGLIKRGYDSDTFSVDNKILEREDIQVTFHSDFGGSVYNEYRVTDIKERGKTNAVLREAEYLEAFGAFFNKEKEAAKAMNRIIGNYQCTKQAVKDALGEREPLRVLWTYWTRYNGPNFDVEGWAVGDRKAYYGEMIDAASGVFVEKEPDNGVAYELDELKEMLEDVDVWIHPAQWGATGFFDYGKWEDFDDVRVVKEGRLFDNQRRGGNAWFEERLASPDALLQDFAKAMYPAVFADLGFTWFRNIAECPEDDCIKRPKKDDCKDIDAPYEWLSTDLCKNDEFEDLDEGECPKKGLEAVKSEDCPDELNLVNCNDEDLKPGVEGKNLCEGDGECGTDPDLDNCSNKYDKKMDIYRLKDNCPREGLEEVDEDDCPDKPKDLRGCQDKKLDKGDFCRAEDEECGTKKKLRNCDGKNVYRVKGGDPPSSSSSEEEEASESSEEASESSEEASESSEEPEEESSSSEEEAPSKECPDGEPECCPANALAPVKNCPRKAGRLPLCNFSPELTKGDLCKVKAGKCGIKEDVGNCKGGRGKINVYEVLGTRKPAGTCPQKGGRNGARPELVEAAVCPDGLGSLPRCDTYDFAGGLTHDGYCSATGECGTEPIGNCKGGKLNIYQVKVPKICPDEFGFELVPAKNCPDKPGLEPRCHFGGELAKGGFCRAKGECGKTKPIGNCRNGDLNIYEVKKDQGQRLPPPK